jgi:hypothetical protein
VSVLVQLFACLGCYKYIFWTGIVNSPVFEFVLLMFLQMVRTEIRVGGLSPFTPPTVSIVPCPSTAPILERQVAIELSFGLDGDILEFAVDDLNRVSEVTVFELVSIETVIFRDFL